MRELLVKVHLKCLEHYGEPAIPTGMKRTAEDGETEIEVYLVYCIHGTERYIWIRRDSI